MLARARVCVCVCVCVCSTLGVITKLDIMDKGTSAVDVLTGAVIPLKLGYVGVVNRSQMDIKEGKPVKEALADERKFFASHPAYAPLAKRCGIAFLAESLNALLLEHIRAFLPTLRERLTQMRDEAAQELAR